MLALFLNTETRQMFWKGSDRYYAGKNLNQRDHGKQYPQLDGSGGPLTAQSDQSDLGISQSLDQIINRLVNKAR